MNKIIAAALKPMTDTVHSGLPRNFKRGLPSALFLAGIAIGGLLLRIGLGADVATSTIMRRVLLHAVVYALVLGTTMPTLGGRILILRPPNHAIVLAITLVLLSGIASLGIGLIRRATEPSQPVLFGREFALRMLIGSLISCAVGVSIAAYARFQASIGQMERALPRREEERETALNLAAETRLASLESNLHPHFLFNTLASIATLVPEDPTRAQRLIWSLSDLLRSAIDSTTHRLIPLDQEMQIVGAYLHIQQERLGGRLTYAADIAENARVLLIPALSIHTLVENCIKHAIEPNTSGGTISVSARVNSDKLVVEVADDGPGFAANPLMSGSGLHNLESRLQLLFGGRAELVIDSLVKGSNIRLSIPSSEVPHAR